MNRPTITMNMACSLDGKITTYEHEKVRFGSQEDRRRLESIRAKADAVLIGAETLRIDDPPLLLRMGDSQALREEHKKEGKHPVNVVVSSSLDFDIEESDFFHHPETRRLVLTTLEADAGKKEKLKEVADVIEVQADQEGKVDLAEAMSCLFRAEIRTLILEGGGSLNFSMLKAQLVDEIFLTLCPYLIGGASSPSILDGFGFSKEEVLRLKLLEAQPGEKGEIFFHYQV